MRQQSRARQVQSFVCTVWLSGVCSACSSSAPAPERRASQASMMQPKSAGASASASQPPALVTASPQAREMLQPPVASVPMLEDGEVCDAQVYDTSRTPLDIYMMIDDSGSMIPWWPATLESIDKFFLDKASEGIGVGLQFFGSVCDEQYYATPVVPIAPLPLNAAALRQAFPLIPVDETATLPALRGAISHARHWATAHPDHKTVVLLVTDGIPEECNSTLDNVSQAAREGFEGKPSIQTFVVGIGDVGAIDQFARAGGTERALVTPGGDTSELTRALNQIRGAALPCEYSLPSAGGPVLQTDRVNLRHTLTGGVPTTIGAVPDAAHCDAVRGGWYFDDRAAPKRVIACPQSCQQLNAGGEVKVLLGCRTIEVVPS